VNTERPHTTEEIRDHWLRNRSADGSDWEKALGAVYDLGASAAGVVCAGCHVSIPLTVFCDTCAAKRS
jgi:hypothetical protein